MEAQVTTNRPEMPAGTVDLALARQKLLAAAHAARPLAMETALRMAAAIAGREMDAKMLEGLTAGREAGERSRLVTEGHPTGAGRR